MSPYPHAVLFVDDEANVLTALKRALKSEPYSCLFADDGESAIKLLATHPVAVLVSDMSMPQMDGPQLLRYVATYYPATLRLVLSGWSDSEVILEAINRGHIYRYITKPWDNRELKMIVRQALELYTLYTEKQELLATLEAHNSRLEQMVESRTQQLLKIRSHAEIGKYASQIVHNLNNPLHALFGALGLTELALSNSEEIDREKLSGFIEQATGSAEGLKQIVSSILLHTRDDSQRHASPIDINTIIRQELDFFNIDRAFNDKVDKQVRLSENLPAIVGNAVQIKQIFDNLIRNAVDAMELCPKKQLNIRTAHIKQSVIVEIGDTGLGISSDDLPHIFSPDFTTKPVGKGTGLGLASVLSMVESYDGDIQVQSEEGIGTKFTIRLPIQRPKEN